MAQDQDPQDPTDTEGHKKLPTPATPEDDTEGHKHWPTPATPDDDSDVEGHKHNPRA